MSIIFKPLSVIDIAIASFKILSGLLYHSNEYINLTLLKRNLVYKLYSIGVYIIRVLISIAWPIQDRFLCF